MSAKRGEGSKHQNKRGKERRRLLQPEEEEMMNASNYSDDQAEMQTRVEERGVNGQEEDEETSRETNEPVAAEMVSFFSDEANRVTRDKYNELMNVIHEHANEEKNMDARSLQFVVLQANDVFGNVKRPTEAAIDAHLLKVCGNMARHNIETTQSSLAIFKPREFAEKLITFAVEEDENDPESDEEFNMIARIGKKASYLFHSVPVLEPLFSAVEWQRPEPKQREKRKRRDLNEKTTHVAQKVETLKDFDGEEEAEAVSWMCKILKQSYISSGNKPVPYFRFVVDPTSFSRTFENIFHVSLLVGEQYAEIKEDEDGFPVIIPTQSIAGGGQGEARQCILSLDRNEWLELIETIDIAHAMIPPRRPQAKKRK